MACFYFKSLTKASLVETIRIIPWGVNIWSTRIATNSGLLKLFQQVYLPYQEEEKKD